MAKFAGMIGFITLNETEPGSGIFMEELVERRYIGEFTKRRVRYVNGDGANSNLQLSDDLSIVADSFAKANIGYMRYAVIHGIKWTITDVSEQFPRLVLSIGGVYNG